MAATPNASPLNPFPTKGEPVLSVRGVARDFDGVTAVEDVDLDVQPGEVVCLLGPSGCGKTTLLRMAAGLEVPQRGEVRIDGRVMTAPGRRPVPPERRNVGLVFQDSALFPHLSVADNVAFGIHGGSSRERRERALRLLDQLGMRRYADTYPHTLSGGQQQRVALARALAPQPGLMLLDEPFSSLDARLRNQIRDDTLHLLKDSGTGTLLVTHDPEEALFMADRIALMRNGRVVQVGSPTELYCRPRDPFVVTFFSDVNEFTATVSGGVVPTALGPVDPGDLPDGTEVSVMIRPEALHVTVCGDVDWAHRRSHVVMSKLLGSSSLVHLCAHDDKGGETHLHARMPGVFLPAPNQPIGIRLDPSQVFVFPVSRADDAPGEIGSAGTCAGGWS